MNVCSSVSTARNGEAILLGLDRVTDPSGDLDLSHAPELVSLPLGSSYSQCADDSTGAVSNAVRFGIDAAISAGYSADQPLHRRPVQQHRTVLLGCAAVGAGFSGEGHTAIQAGEGDNRACKPLPADSLASKVALIAPGLMQRPSPSAAGTSASTPRRRWRSGSRSATRSGPTSACRCRWTAQRRCS